MKGFAMCVVAWLLVLDVGIASSSSEDIVVELENGCTLTRRNSTTSYVSWYGIALPHLNCSGRNLTRLKVEGVVEDTRTITLSYNDMIQFHIDDLDMFPNLEKLNLKSNKLERIIASSTTPRLVISSTKHLILTHNLLDKIPNEALKSFPNLKTLMIFSNQINHIYDDDFRFNPKLQRIYLGPNPIEAFEDKWLGRLNLTSLVLRGCGLIKLPSNIRNVSSLAYLDMSDNAIPQIPPSGFSGCTSLFWLELASNKIESIGNGAFKSCSNLRMIDLSNNQLTTLVGQTFAGISKENLEIDLYENPIRCDCRSAGFKSWYDDAKEVDMASEVRYKCKQPLRNHGKMSHQLSQIDYSCMSTDVQWEDCSAASTPSPKTTSQSPRSPPPAQVDNRSACPKGCACFDEKGKLYSGSASQVPKYKFRKMSYPSVVCINKGLRSIPTRQIRSDVKYILMSGNRIPTLDIAQLNKFTDLTLLNLKSNGIKSIRASYRTVLSKVSILNLRFNSISMVSRSHMRSFPNVAALRLYHNSLTFIPKDIFAENKKLQQIYLGPNPIKNFTGSFLTGLDLLKLSLRNMSLTRVPPQIGRMARDVLTHRIVTIVCPYLHSQMFHEESLYYLDLSDNRIKGLKNGTFSTCTALAKLVLDNNQISSVQPNAFNGATNLRSIFLSENELTFLPRGVFSNVSSERLAVELWRNKFLCDCKLKWLKEWIEQMNAEDPTTDIRFPCEQPARLHNKVSNEITPDDFVCQSGEPLFKLESTCQASKSSIGSIALAVVLTFLTTVMCCVIAWRCGFRKRYSQLLQYGRQEDAVYDEMEDI